MTEERPDIARIVTHATILGDLAIISIPDNDKTLRIQIVEALIGSHKKVRTVLNKTSLVSGDARVPHFELLYGENTIAHYAENGFIYAFDARKVFFNPRMSFEHRRIAGLVKPGESIFLPFCGAGPFALPIAAAGCRVLALDSNADACKWLTTNARDNKVSDYIDVLNADILRAPLKTKFDRAVVPAPYLMDNALGVSMRYVKAGGHVHFYAFKKKHELETLILSYERMGLAVEHYRACGNVAHDVKRWAFDLRLHPP